MSRRWTLGDTFVLRHAGFPFDWMEELGYSRNVRRLTEEVLDCEVHLANLSETTGGKGASEATLRSLQEGRGLDSPRPATEEWRRAVRRWNSIRAELRDACQEEKVTLKERLKELASEPRVQEAVFLSSPDMYENVWRRYVELGDIPDNARWRRVERQVYTYLQRFCAKNETTSFFGPMGYGEVTEHGMFEVRNLARQRRRTFFSFRAVRELTRAIGRDRDLILHLPARLNRLYEIVPGAARSRALDEEVPLSPEAERMMRWWKDFSGTLTEASSAFGLSPSALLKIAAPLLRAGVLLLRIDFEPNDFESFESLRAAVRALPHQAGRTRWLNRLDRLDALREEFESAELEARVRLLKDLERLFSEYTGADAHEGAGEVYADRLVLYEEASSRFSIRMGKTFTEALENKLSEGLELSAAYGERVQRGYKDAARQVLEHEDDRIDLLTYAARTRPRGDVGSRFSPLPKIEIEPEEVRSLSLPQELCGSSSAGGRYSLPDVFLAAPAGEITPENVEVILGRVHHHLLLWGWLCAFYPDRRKFEFTTRDWLRRDPSATSLVGLELGRRNKGFYCFPGRRAGYPGRDYGADLSMADLDVEIGQDGPVARDDHARKVLLYLPLADYTTYPPFAALAHPLVLHAPIAGGAHVPRLRVGGAVYQRERWTLDCSVRFEKLRGVDLLLSVQRERRRSGWPRFVFARIADERKPVLIDTWSPFGAELLRRMARGGKTVIVEEMLPAPEHLWLRDERGRRYTCELRMQAVRWSDDVD